MEPDPEKIEKLKKELLELDYLYEEAMDAEAANDRAYDRIMRAVTDAAMTIYPELKEMEPDQIRQFGDRISTHVFRIVEELDVVRDPDERLLPYAVPVVQRKDDARADRGQGTALLHRVPTQMPSAAQDEHRRAVLSALPRHRSIP